MTGDAWLDELLWRITSREDGADIIGAAELRDGPMGSVAELSRLGILVQCAPASRVVCPACEDGHEEPVYLTTDVAMVAHAAVRCPLFGRVEIELSELVRWQLKADGFASFLRAELGLEGRRREIRLARAWELGFFRSGGARQRVLLDLDATSAVRLEGPDTREGSAFALADLVAWNGATLAPVREALRDWPAEERIDLETQTSSYRLSRNGKVWAAAFDGVELAPLADMKGLRDIHLLLSRAGQPVPVTEIEDLGLVAGAVELITPVALRELRALIATHDVRDEEVARYLRQVCRLDGRPRATASPLVRATNAVRNRIDRAIREIDGESAAMAQHLDFSITRGMVLSYRPPMPMPWVLS